MIGRIFLFMLLIALVIAIAYYLIRPLFQRGSFEIGKVYGKYEKEVTKPIKGDKQWKKK